MNKLQKIYPIIFDLIIISFIGLVTMQYIWFNDAVTIQNNKYERDIRSAMDKISYELLVQIAYNKNIKNDNVDFRNPMIQTTLLKDLSRLDESEINKIINESLRSYKLNTTFDYVILKGAAIIHQSKNYENRLSDIAYNNPLDYGKEYTLYLFLEQQSDGLQIKNWSILLVMLLFTTLITFVFIISLRTLHSQKKLTEVTNDFINNMTHEFKTPISVINLAAATMENPKVQANPDMLNSYAKMIKDECSKMNSQVQRILEIAKSEEKGMLLDKTTIHINKLIEELGEGYALKAQEQNGHIQLNIIADHDQISGDKLHITNILNTIFDNAIKYSKPNVAPNISITTKNIKSNEIEIWIEDNGIGMDKESLQNAFKRFYRASSGNLHNVKGFGLGLSYVKNVMHAHKAKTSIQSQIGKGTLVKLIFTLDH